jgi:hypothetical protein
MIIIIIMKSNVAIIMANENICENNINNNNEKQW